MSLKVMITDQVGPDLVGEQNVLSEIGAELVLAPDTSEQTLVKYAKGSDAIISNWAKTTDRVIAAALPSLKIVARTGIGVDNIDVAFATTKGIPVTNVPAYCLPDVAEQAMALLLALARKVAYYDRHIRTGHWERTTGPAMQRLEGKTFGIVGLGKIGRELIPRASGFKMEVIGHDPYVSAEQGEKIGVKMVDLNTLLATADVVDLHCPLMDSTRNLINADTLRRMKPPAYLINTARGELVDEDALYEALTTGQIAGAGLDVRHKEPPDPNDRLVQLPNVAQSPHASYYTAVRELQELTAWEVRRVLTGESPLNVVNPKYKQS